MSQTGIESKNGGSPVFLKLFKKLITSKKFPMKMLANQIKPADKLVCTCLILIEGKGCVFLDKWPIWRMVL